MRGGRGEKSRFRDEVEGKEGLDVGRSGRKDCYGVGGDNKGRGKQEKGQWRERVGNRWDGRLEEGWRKVREGKKVGVKGGNRCQKKGKR